VRQGTIRDSADADPAEVDADPSGAAAAPTLTIPPDLAAALATLTAANALPRTATIDGSDRVDRSRAEPSTHQGRLVSGATSAIVAVASGATAGHSVHTTAGARPKQATSADAPTEAAALPAALPTPSALDPIALAAGTSTPEAKAVPDAPPSGVATAIDVAAFKRDGTMPKSAGVSLERRVDQDMRSPQFGSALGAQVTLLTREGVQQARLTLHPAEMGPISVQIALDGKAAHVDFHAEVAATRSAIEAALPALASALRDAGFTLAGGGVFQHHGGGRQHAGDQAPASQPRPSASSDSDLASGLVAPALGRSLSGRGLVDLYA
jgi:flagellar hook-length control protein FliK